MRHLPRPLAGPAAQHAGSGSCSLRCRDRSRFLKFYLYLDYLPFYKMDLAPVALSLRYSRR